MKRQGFTLVELLAVIAILAILVIIALPNVMGMFNQAKENSFTTEVKTIFQQAEQQWITDSMMKTGKITYARNSGGTRCRIVGTEKDTTKGIDLSGRQELEYEITISQAGKVVKFSATDGTYTMTTGTNELTDAGALAITDIGGTKAPILSVADGNTAVSIVSCN